MLISRGYLNVDSTHACLLLCRKVLSEQKSHQVHFGRDKHVIMPFRRMNMRRFILSAAATIAIVSFANAQTATMTEETETEVFVTAKPTDVLSYNLIGLSILNGDNTTIGEIKDLIISDGHLAGYIISVGGFLGVGEKYVVVSPEAVDITYFDDEKKWSAVMNSTKDEIQKAPEFKYEGRWAK